MSAIRHPIVYCRACCAPHPLHPTKGCRGCRTREKEKDAERLSHPSTWQTCPRCRQLAPLRRPRSICSDCARALVHMRGPRVRRPEPTAAELAVMRQRKAAKAAERAAMFAQARADRAARRAPYFSPVMRRCASLAPLREAVRAARDTVERSKAAAAQAQVQVETDRAALRAACRALRAARQDYARMCRGSPVSAAPSAPLDPTL